MSSHDAHYFRTPTGPADHHDIDVVLGGRPVRVRTAAGVFSGDRLDPGTRVLLRTVPEPPQAGHLLDLGCGWGPVALSLALRAPRAEVWAVDVNDLALTLTEHNAARLGLRNLRPLGPDDVPPQVRFAAIWSNPPIRVGKAALHDLLLRWIPRLTDGACAHLVVQRHLGADSLLGWIGEHLLPGLGEGATVDRIASSQGYRVLRVTRGTNPGSGS